MPIPRLVTACLATVVLVVSSRAEDLSVTEVRARDFSFQGIPFGCSTEQFKRKYPDAELLPDPPQDKKSLQTRADRTLNAVRYSIKHKRDRDGRTDSQFYTREYLFVDDRMVEFSGLDTCSQPDATERYFKLFCETLGEPGETWTGKDVDGMRYTWRFPSVGREFVLNCSEEAAVLFYLGRDTGAITALTKKQMASRALDEQVEKLFEEGKFAEAETLAKRSVDEAIRQKGPDHPDTAKKLVVLARVYTEQGKQAQAEPLLKHALAIRERMEPDRLTTADSLRALAYCVLRQGKFDEAEPLLQRALAIREKTHGPEHAETAGSLNDLGVCYLEQDDYGKAEPLLKRALAIRERAEPDQLETADSLCALAYCFLRQGRCDEAEPLDKRALAIREKLLGPEHPDIARSLTSLAAVAVENNRYNEAESFQKRALAIRETALGPEHPDTAESLVNLSGLYSRQDKHDEAEALVKRALAVMQKAYGLDHPKYAMVLRGLAKTYDRQGKHAQAETLYKSALVIFEKSFGPEHPQSTAMRDALAAMRAKAAAKQASP